MRCRRSGWAWCWRVVGVKLATVPPAGMRDPVLEGGFLDERGDVLRHLVLPAATLSVVSIAGTMRYQRTAMIETLRLPYIVTARAKGLTDARSPGGTHGETRCFRDHPVRSLASDPGQRLGLRGGGIRLARAGSLAATAVSYRDYPLLMGASVLVATLVVRPAWPATSPTRRSIRESGSLDPLADGVRWPGRRRRPRGLGLPGLPGASRRSRGRRSCPTRSASSISSTWQASRRARSIRSAPIS